MSARLSVAELVRRCDEWNARYPIGTPVRMRLDRRSIDTKTRGRALVLSSRRAVVWLAGIWGGHALDRVTPRLPERRA